MPDRSSHTEFYQAIIENVETIFDWINELFGEESNEDGLFSTRSSLLQQFAILASAYHQLNSLDFLKNDSDMSQIFNNELNTANYRTRDYEHRAMRKINKYVKDMEEYLDRVVEVSEEVHSLQIECDQYIEHIENSYYENIVISVSFYLQEINSRILEPAGTIMQAEITGSTKLIDTIEAKFQKAKDISTEAVARMCEVLSWGLESPPGWKVIQNDTNELTGNLEKKIGSLKAITTYYHP